MIELSVSKGVLSLVCVIIDQAKLELINSLSTVVLYLVYFQCKNIAIRFLAPWYFNKNEMKKNIMSDRLTQRAISTLLQLLQR